MKNILIPTDLSDCTRDTLKYAIKFSVKSNTKLFFYHISEKAGITSYMKDFIGKIFSEMNIDMNSFQAEYITDKGDFTNEKIKRTIKKNDIDLVIMGASHEAFRNTFFGTFVSDLINEVGCPVLSVPHGYKGNGIETIGFASELFDLKKRIKEIIPFAKLFDANIEVFHVYPVYPKVVDIETFNVEKVLTQIKKENDYEKISLHFIKTGFDNEPVKGIMKYLNTNKPDLLVMSHKPRGLFDKLSLDKGATTSVIKSSSFPILALNKKSKKKIM
ncbi:MAG TPA: universal stress protein [Bacteroidales bacterium]|mgnify:CR=1 FL=1|nr:universal stress protein [Bacteroidales bacterium]HPS15838.1 universal stress protein [Bacteroidales bacterium]